METKKEYMAPELTVVTFKTEKGYAASGDQLKLVNDDFMMLFDNESPETWSNDNTTFMGGDDFWQ